MLRSAGFRADLLLPLTAEETAECLDRLEVAERDLERAVSEARAALDPERGPPARAASGVEKLWDYPPQDCVSTEDAREGWLPGSDYGSLIAYAATE